MISPPWVAMRLETFAVSMLDPPPTATKPSKPPSTAKSAAAWKESCVGSTRERSHTSTSTPSASINSSMRPVIFAITIPGSDTSITRPTPIRFSSQPASSEAPGPYLSGVASIVKMVSLFEFCMVVSFLSPRSIPGHLIPASVGGYTYGPRRQRPTESAESWCLTLESSRLVHFLERKDGSRFLASTVTTALYEAGGKPRGFSEVMQDLTEMKEGEKLLEETGNRLRTLVEHVPAITYTGGVDGDHALDYVSPQLENVLGYSPNSNRHIPILHSTASRWMTP